VTTVETHRQYFSGLCRCGHTFEQHHTSAIVNQGVLASLPPGHPPYIAEECCAYDFNEGSGMGPDGRDHCHRFIDRDDPSAVAHNEPGTFTRLARAAAWGRSLGQLTRALLTGKKTPYRRQRP
jgi:hypothetical protein